MNADEMSSSGASQSAPARTSRKFRMHWHVTLTHFPISAFFGAFLFTALHLATRNECYVLATYVSLLTGTASILPVTATGWSTWRNTYRGSRRKLFMIKIWIAAGMIVISIGLAVYQTLHPFHVLDLSNEFGHVFYIAGVLLLMVGAGAEGFWGGQLHHR